MVDRGFASSYARGREMSVNDTGGEFRGGGGVHKWILSVSMLLSTPDTGAFLARAGKEAKAPGVGDRKAIASHYGSGTKTRRLSPIRGSLPQSPTTQPRLSN